MSLFSFKIIVRSLSIFVCFLLKVTFQLQPARVYLEDTFVYYIKTLFYTYIPERAVASIESKRSKELGPAPILPEQVLYL